VGCAAQTGPNPESMRKLPQANNAASLDSVAEVRHVSRKSGSTQSLALRPAE
jgi:hypothetical protein